MERVTLLTKSSCRLPAAGLLCLALLLAGGMITLAQGMTAEFFSDKDPKYSYTVSYNTLEELIASLTNDPLQGHLQGFNQNTDHIKVYSNAGGLAITVLAPQNSSSFTLSIPGLSYTKTFTGSDRAATTASMVVWAATDPDGIVAQVEAQVQAAAAMAGSGNSADSSGCFVSTIR